MPAPSMVNRPAAHTQPPPPRARARACAQDLYMVLPSDKSAKIAYDGTPEPGTGSNIVTRESLDATVKEAVSKMVRAVPRC